MLLTIDVGNTQTVCGVYEGKSLLHMWRLSTDRTSTADEIRVNLIPLFAWEKLEIVEIEACALASVVPQLTDVWCRAVGECCGVEPLVCSAKTAAGLFEPDYPNPDEIGADRVADAVAMRAIYGAPCVVVDFGTATNIEAIDERGCFVGGIIAPGLQTSAQTLFSRGAKLPAIDLHAPAHVIGKNTAEAMQSGIVLGEVERVDGLLRRVFDQLGYSAKVVATGGLAPLIAKHSAIIEEVNPQLTLEGLRLIMENRAN
jgi:type III pantothenate kinase